MGREPGGQWWAWMTAWAVRPFPVVAHLPWWPLRPLHPPSLQGWVFNVVPWLVAIPASLFSGLLSDRLINQGEPWGRGRAGSHAWALPHSGGQRGTPPGVLL